MRLLLTIAFVFNTFALSPLDEALSKLITKHNLTSLPESQLQNQNEVILGSRLFAEVRLSGNKDITCMHCHHPMLGTGDNIPFSIGTGGAGLGKSRIQDGKGLIIKRHAPALINLGYDEITDMFWDGRVHVDWSKGEFKTPSSELNAKTELNRKIRNALAAQVIFPLLSVEEMLGKDNEIASQKGDLAKWDAYVDRLLNGSKSAMYQNLFKRAYPKDFKAGKIDISHVANALAAFITRNFNLIDTPYDEYLNGDLSALNESEKRGLKTFLDKGACINCHSGQHLTDWDYKSIGLPQIGPISATATLNDKGRFEVTGNKADQYNFRTPPLRNIHLSAPYMHNGVYETLEEVVDHYNHTRPAIKNYIVNEVTQGHYEEKIVKDENFINNKLRYQLISDDDIRRPLKLTEDEKADLVQFLKTGLASRRLQRLEEASKLLK
ncbi:cytochrome-c peroxidase [Halobacteriovorax sp. GFR7]|uniref:cytochrome-c peroxidase n=1 Tax=unclassified Halobacteriovorax TaxID=2639665 RepID=UPI003D95A45E